MSGIKGFGGASQSSMRAISGRPATLNYLKAGATALEEEEKAYELRQRELVDAVNDGKACPGLIDGCSKLGSIRDAETRKDLVDSVCSSDFAVCYGLVIGKES